MYYYYNYYLFLTQVPTNDMIFPTMSNKSKYTLLDTFWSVSKNVYCWRKLIKIIEFKYNLLICIEH